MQDHYYNTSGKEQFHTARGLSSAYTSLYGVEGEGRSQWAELEATRLRNKKLEREVSALGQQLVDKNQLADRRTEELTQFKTMLAQEKSAHVLAVHETQGKAAKEVGRVRVLHAEQINELEAQVKQLRTRKQEADEDSTRLRVSLTGEV